LLISQIFIKEIENKENSFFINQLIQTYYKKEKMANILIKMFFYFLIDISQYYQEKNSQIINNNDLVKKNNDIIDECARAQVEAKKKNKKLKEQIAQKDKIIEQMKLDYQTQITKMNDNFSQILQKNENEIASLRNELTNKTKRT
jgi:hypothetical protein